MKYALAAALGVALLTPVGAQKPTPAPQRPAAPASRPARTEAAVPFKVGETLTYDVSWSSLLVAGTAVATVKEKRASYNSTAYYIVADGRPVPLLQRLYNLYYKMDSLVDSFTLLSQRGSLYSEEGGDRQLNSTVFDRTARRARFERQADTTEKIDVQIPSDAQDGLAVLYTLRARPLKAGDRSTITVADTGAIYTVAFEVGSLEQVRVPAGTYQAWRITGTITDAEGEQIWKNIAVWIGQDGSRPPVKMQAELPVGHFVLALREMR